MPAHSAQPLPTDARTTIRYDRARVPHNSATAAVHTLPGPVGGEPAHDGIGERHVEIRSPPLALPTSQGADDG